MDWITEEWIEANPQQCMEVDEQGNTLLHLAASKGLRDVAFLLMQVGKIPWNVVNLDGKSVGEAAKENGHLDLYQDLVSNGVRTEFVLTLLGQKVVEDGDLIMKLEGTESGDNPLEELSPKQVHNIVSNSEYLERKLEYTPDGAQLLDSDKNAVMMGWETPLMELHCKVIAPSKGRRVLNVGFGLGIIDRMLQEQEPTLHTIIEAHPDVYRKMIADGWDQKPGVQILFGRWQDVIDQLQVYDGIFFDTFGEYYDDLKQFHEVWMG
jgi:protein arginine N-methyltransferase 2